MCTCMSGEGWQLLTFAKRNTGRIKQKLMRMVIYRGIGMGRNRVEGSGMAAKLY